MSLVCHLSHVEQLGREVGLMIPLGSAAIPAASSISWQKVVHSAQRNGGILPPPACVCLERPPLSSRRLYFMYKMRKINCF